MGTIVGYGLLCGACACFAGGRARSYSAWKLLFDHIGAVRGRRNAGRHAQLNEHDRKILKDNGREKEEEKRRGKVSSKVKKLFYKSFFCDIVDESDSLLIFNRIRRLYI